MAGWVGSTRGPVRGVEATKDIAGVYQDLGDDEEGLDAPEDRIEVCVLATVVPPSLDNTPTVAVYLDGPL